MTSFIIKKSLLHLSVGALIYFLILKFSPMGSVYAGWFSGLLGACYLLAGWNSYLKTKGSDFMSLLRIKKEPGVPYYLRGANKNPETRFSISGAKHDFDDDLEESCSDNPDGKFSFGKYQLGRAVSFTLTGIILFLLSAF